MSEQESPLSSGSVKDNSPIKVAVIALALVLLVVVLVVLFDRPAAGPPPVPRGPDQAQEPVQGLPEVGPPKAAAIPAAGPLPSVVVEVRAPAELFAVLDADPWLAQAQDSPLGRGFLGPWAGFLGTRGEDLKASFSGTVLRHLSAALLTDPFRLVYFAGEAAPGSPALLVSAPSASARAGYAALDLAARRGIITVARCPGEPEPPAPAEGADAGAQAPRFEVARWLVADFPLYAAQAGDRLVLGKNLNAVIFGLCVGEEAVRTPATPGAELEISLLSGGLGRDFQLLTHLLGVRGAPRLAFAAEEGRLVPKGIAAELDPGRLATGPLDKKLLRVVPEVMPVVLALQPQLPASLEVEALRAHFAAGAPAGGTPRQAALLWRPRGADPQATELALLWSRVEDEAALVRIFSGKNKLLVKRVCEVVALASTEALLAELERTCGGQQPSLLSAPPALQAGWQAATSLVLGVQPGRLLSGLLEDAYLADEPVKKPGVRRVVPPEIEAARRQLESLPSFGLTGTAGERALVPGGFRT